jgi:hypothetical protein
MGKVHDDIQDLYVFLFSVLCLVRFDFLIDSCLVCDIP